MQRSVNWYFSELDRRSGIRKLEEFYRKIGYGNEYVGKDTETYWNGSALKISAVEQTELLKKFYHNEFGFKEENVSAVKEAMLVAQSGDVRLYGKTGTGSRGTEVQDVYKRQILDRTRNPVGAISVSASTNRIRDTIGEEKVLTKAIVAAAGRISAKLGFFPK